MVYYGFASRTGLRAGLAQSQAEQRSRNFALTGQSFAQSKAQDSEEASKRFWEVDALRGTAVLLMLGFHTAVLLTATMPALAANLQWLWWLGHHANVALGCAYAVFASSQSDGLEKTRLGKKGAWASRLAFWGGIGALVGACNGAGDFMFLAGISMTLSYYRNVDTLGENQLGFFAKRGLQLVLLGLGLSSLSLFWVPNMPILFGILSFIGTAISTTSPMLRFPAKYSLGLGLAFHAFTLLIAPILQLPMPLALLAGSQAPQLNMQDYWWNWSYIGNVLLGIFAGKQFFPQGKRSYQIPDSWAKQPFVRFSTWAGRNALTIYLGHYPLYLGLLGTAGTAGLAQSQLMYHAPF